MAWDVFGFLLVLLVGVLLAGIFLLLRQVASLSAQLQEVSFRKASQSVRYGQLTEQWIPFSKEFPFDSADFKFLGQPVDGIAFTEDKIVFCEFKANESGLSATQKRIRDQVKDKKVEWMEFRAK
ncbi:MAG: endonuclease [Candidatus Diapherotrites archaeon]|nr:endonuclease [Candidatus Diapherotrites archaeon]